MSVGTKAFLWVFFCWVVAAVVMAFMSLSMVMDVVLVVVLYVMASIVFVQRFFKCNYGAMCKRII